MNKYFYMTKALVSALLSVHDGTGYDGGEYCDFNSVAASAMAGKDILLGIWDSTGTNILAVAGQKGLTLNRSAETIEVTSKDTEGGWKASITGMKEWSIDLDGVYVNGDNSHKILANAFQNGSYLCVKVYNKKLAKGLYGGLAVLTDYPLEAPHDDAVTYSISLAGVGKLTDFSIEEPTSDILPS